MKMAGSPYAERATALAVTPLRVLTVDDEHLALRRLEQVLSRIDICVHVGSATGCSDALRQVHRLRPDVLLLGIQMRDGSGFDLLEKLPDDLVPAVVFVTAFDHFALQAFDRNAVDYVLKPVSPVRLEEAIDRARKRVLDREASIHIQALRDAVGLLKAQLTEQESEQSAVEFWVRGGGGVTRISCDDILWVGVEENYVKLHTIDGPFALRESIRSFSERMDSSQFVRVHRKALVRLSAVRALRRSDAGAIEIELINGERVRAGRVYAKGLKKRLFDPTRRAQA